MDIIKAARRDFRPILAPAIILIAIFYLFGCGTPGKNMPVTEVTATIAADQAQDVKINVESFYFNPSRINVVVGIPVRLTLTNHAHITPHNFSIHAPEAGMDLDMDIGTRKTVTIELTPTKIGEYEFYCDKDGHHKKGMAGKLVVKER